MRQIARARLNHPQQPKVGIDLERKLGPDAVPVGSSAGQFDPQQVVLVAVLVTEQACRAIGLGNHQVQIAVIVEVSIGSAPAHDRTLQC